MEEAPLPLLHLIFTSEAIAEADWSLAVVHLSHRQNIKEPFLSFLCPFTSLHVEIKIKWRRLPPEGCGRFWGLCISAAEEMLDINGRPGQSVEKRRKDLWQREMQKRKVNGAAPPTLNTLSSQNASLAPSEGHALCLRVRKSSRGKLIVLIAPWKMLVRSHNSTKQPKWQQWAQPVPALPFAAPPWRCGSNVLPRGMLTGNGTWPAPESSSVTGIFLNSPASSLKPLAIVARNDCTNCSISALLRHTKRISISFFGVVERGHGPNEMVTAMGGCCRECNKRAGTIESQPCSSVPLKNHQSQTCSVYCIARAIKRLRGPRPLPRRRAKDLNWTLPSKCPVMWFHLFPLSFRHKKACQWEKSLLFWSTSWGRSP